MSETSTPPVLASRPRPRPPLGWPLALVVGVVALALAVSALVVDSGNGKPRGRISVTATATVSGVPDTATFQIGVNTTRATAESALLLNNRQTAALEHALEGAGVPVSGLQTNNVSINADYNDYGRITGYTASDTLTVTMHDVSKAGAAITAAAKVAGNNIQLSGVSFSISNGSALRARARAQAMHNAATAAGQLANAGGSSLNGLLSVVDHENQSPPPYFYPVPLDHYALSANAIGAPVPIQAGKMSITISVSVVFALAN